MANYEMTYSTPDAVARNLQIADPAGVPNSAQALQYAQFMAFVREAVRTASALVDAYTSNKFAPYVDTRRYVLRDYLFRNTFRFGRFQLDAYLLEVDSVTWPSGVLSAAQYYLHPVNLPPYTDLLIDTATVAWNTDFSSVVEVAGIWGDHPNYAQAYTPVTTLTAGINASVTTIPVASSAAIEQLHYIRIGSELMQVTSVASSTSVVVERGVNGFTATAHDNGATVEVFRARQEVWDATTRLASWLYQHRNDMGDRVQFPDGTTIIASMPIIIRQALARVVWQRSFVI